MQENTPQQPLNSQENPLDQRLQKQITEFLSFRHTMPLTEQLGEGLRLASRKLFPDSIPTSVYRDLQSLSHGSPEEWSNTLKAAYARGKGSKEDAAALQPDTSATVAKQETIALVTSQDPDAPLSLHALLVAVAEARGPEQLKTYLDSRYQSFKSLKLPDNQRSLVLLDASAHSAVQTQIVMQVEMLLQSGLKMTVANPEQFIREKLQNGMHALGYLHAMNTYTNKHEDRFNPTTEFPHPLCLWRAAMRLQFTRQKYDDDYYKRWISRRRAIFNDLVSMDYNNALKKLTKLDEDFPRMVSEHWLLSAQGLQEPDEVDS